MKETPNCSWQQSLNPIPLPLFISTVPSQRKINWTALSPAQPVGLPGWARAEQTNIPMQLYTCVIAVNTGTASRVLTALIKLIISILGENAFILADDIKVVCNMILWPQTQEFFFFFKKKKKKQIILLARVSNNSGEGKSQSITQMGNSFKARFISSPSSQKW